LRVSVSKVDNPEVMETASSMIGIATDALTKALVSRNIGTRSVILVSYSPDQV